MFFLGSWLKLFVFFFRPGCLEFVKFFQFIRFSTGHWCWEPFIWRLGWPVFSQLEPFFCCFLLSIKTGKSKLCCKPQRIWRESIRTNKFQVLQSDLLIPHMEVISALFQRSQTIGPNEVTTWSDELVDVKGILATPPPKLAPPVIRGK